MVNLSDTSIIEAIRLKELVIRPFDIDLVQPSTIDMRLGSQFRVFKQREHTVIDIKEQLKNYTKLVRMPKGKPYILHPFEFLLGTTKEWVEIPNNIVARMDGKSSLGRLGVLVHSTAGYVDPGFKGHLTLEIINVGKLPVTLYPGMRICQLSFIRMSTPAMHPYGSGKTKSKYQGQHGPTESRIHMDFKK